MIKGKKFHAELAMFLLNWKYSFNLNSGKLKLLFNIFHPTLSRSTEFHSLLFLKCADKLEESGGKETQRGVM